MRTWTILTALLLASAALAGCTSKDDGDDGAADGSTPDAGGSGPGNGTATVEDFLLEDAGMIQGPFQESWDVVVENVAFRSALVEFALQGVQAGAPPAARVQLVLSDPDGAPVKTATLGIGGEGDSVSWTLTNAEIQAAGTYTLQATAQQGPVPSGGVAQYTLHAVVDY